MKDREATTSKIVDLADKLRKTHRRIAECDNLIRNTTQQDAAYRGPATFGVQVQHSWVSTFQPGYTPESFGMTMEDAREWIVQMVTAQREKLIAEHTALLKEISDAAHMPRPAFNTELPKAIAADAAINEIEKALQRMDDNDGRDFLEAYHDEKRHIFSVIASYRAPKEDEAFERMRAVNRGLSWAVRAKSEEEQP